MRKSLKHLKKNHVSAIKSLAPNIKSLSLQTKLSTKGSTEKYSLQLEIYVVTIV